MVLICKFSSSDVSPFAYFLAQGTLFDVRWVITLLKVLNSLRHKGQVFIFRLLFGVLLAGEGKARQGFLAGV